MNQNNINEICARVFGVGSCKYYELIKRECNWNEFGGVNVNIVVRERLCLSDGSYSHANKQFVSNLLLVFTLYDGWLEDKYSLVEGASFKAHYDGLPYSTNEERIQKDCYRILKILRNTIQHNLSALVLDKDNNVSLSYLHRNTDFKLSISNKGMELLFGLVRYIISGANKEHLTRGHYLATIAMVYKAMIREITNISDEFGTCIVVSISNDIVCFDCDMRYIFGQCAYEHVGDSVIKLRHDDEYANCNNKLFGKNKMDYTVEYQNKSYVLPEEIGKITKDEYGTFISFETSKLTNTWEKI